MKKLLLVLLCAFLLVGCGETKKESSKTYSLDAVKNAVSSYYPEAEEITLEKLGKKYEFQTSYVEEGLILMPTLANNADMFLFLKASDKENAKKEVEELFKMFLTQYEMYYEKEYQKLKDRTSKEDGDYLIYIVSNDADKILKAIEESH